MVIAASAVSSATTASTSAALPGGDEAVDDLAQAVVAERAQRRLLAALGQPLVDGLVRRAAARCRPTPASSRARSATSRAGEAEHVAQDQHGALARRQVLQRGDERELDALALLVAGLGPASASVEAERSSG